MSVDQLPGNKRGQKPDLSDCKSLDPANSCEICGESLECLCHVTYENKKTGEIFEWKAERISFSEGPILPKVSRIDYLTRNTESVHYFVGLKEIDLDYTFIYKCKHNQSRCVTPFYYQAAKPGDGVEDDILKFTEISPKESGSINLKYDESLLEILSDKKKQKYILDKGELKPIELGSRQYAPDYLSRRIGFLLQSDYEGIPITPYYIAGYKCIDGKMLKNPKPRSGEAGVMAIVLPDYKVVGKATVGFENEGKTKYIADKAYSLPSTLGFQVKVEKLEEWINGKQLNNQEFNITTLSKFVPEDAFPYNILAFLDKWLSRFELPTFPSDLIPISLEITPPKIELDGEAELKYEEETGELSVVRSDTTISCAPLIGFKIELDLIEALLMICPPFKAYYQLAKNDAKKIKSFKFTKKGEGTKISAEDFKKEKEKAESRLLGSNWNPLNWFASELIIYANALFEGRLNLEKYAILTSKVNEKPEDDSNLFNTEIILEVELGLQYKIKAFVFSASLKAHAEAKASWTFRYLKEFIDQNDIRGSIENGDGENREIVIEYSGLRFRWEVTFKMGTLNEKNGNNDIWEVGINNDSDENETVTRDELMLQMGFKRGNDGQIIDDEAFYEQPEDLDASFYDGLYTNPLGSGISAQQSYEFMKDYLENARDKRQTFREYDNGEQTFSKPEVIYPAHRKGPVKIKV